MTTTLQYKRINLAKRETRLLEIETGQDIDDPIRCRLVNVKITDDLEFIGLAALWGNPDETEPIWINGTRTNLPANVGQALRNVRAVFRREQGSLRPPSSHNNTNSSSRSQQSSLSASTGPPGKGSNGGGGAKRTPTWLRVLLRGVRSILPDERNASAAEASAAEAPLRVWLDCICIDGQDPKEEAQRKAHLAMVYGAAKLVVGWLGLKDETSDMAIGILRTLDRLCPQNFGEPEDRRDHPENYGPRMDFLKPIAEQWEVSFQEVGRPEDSPMFQASVNFLGRPLFNRLWILQEVALSNYPAFLLGDEIVSWMQMLRFNRLNEEVRDHGCIHLPKPVMEVIVNLVELGTVHTFLEDYSKRRAKRMELAKTERPISDVSGSTLEGTLTPTTSAGGNSIPYRKPPLSSYRSWRRKSTAVGDTGLENR